MKRIRPDDGLSWVDFCDAVGVPRTIDTAKNDMKESKVRQGLSLDSWHEQAVKAAMEGKRPKPKKEKPLIAPGSKEGIVPVEPAPRREISQAPVNSQPSMWEAG